MRFVLLGAGKTGALVAEIAGTRGHSCEIIEVTENRNGVALTKQRLAGIDAVIDFTTPDAVMTNIEATVRAGANMVVGTTGWYSELPHVRNQVERARTGFIWASNFSMGVNLFFAIVREGAKALKYGYERPHQRDPPRPQARRTQRHRRLAGQNHRAVRRQKSARSIPSARARSSASRWTVRRSEIAAGLTGLQEMVSSERRDGVAFHTLAIHGSGCGRRVSVLESWTLGACGAFITNRWSSRLGGRSEPGCLDP